jgi:multidrug efflux pump subunit AcrA (membrane-fusion protein)
MESNRIISGVVKLAVLLVAAGALYYLWGEQFPGAAAQNSGQDSTLTQTNVLVDVTTIQRGTLHGSIVAYGSVQPAPGTTTRPAAGADVSAPTRCLVDTVTCAEGQMVHQGDPLFTVDLRDQAQNLVLTYSAPISGTVTEVKISAGDVADPRKTAVKIVDLNRLIVEVAVPAAELGAVRSGQGATIELPSDRAATEPSVISSTVDRVDPAVDAKTNLGMVDITVPSGTNARLGELAKVSIFVDQHADCLVVPAESIVRDSLDRTFVGVVSDDGSKAALQLVETGLREGNLVEISGENISEGQTIVTTGAPALLARTDIKIRGR